MRAGPEPQALVGQKRGALRLLVPRLVLTVSAPAEVRRRVLRPVLSWMDRETRALADRHFRGLGGDVPGVGQAPGRVAFVSEPGAFSYADFVRGFLLPNLPCVFSSAFTQGWGSRRRWVTPAGRPDFDHLLRTYGDVVVPVANCGVQEYNSNPKEHMTLRDYITYWKEYIQAGYSSPRGCLYLKDWHLCRDFPVEDVFTLPVYFSSDWLNEFWDALDVDDYRFVYAGPAGSWSPFHADIFRSFSWSVNVCGRKKWLLFPPGQEEALRDRHGNLPYDVTSPALCDTHLHPRSQLAGPPLEITQEAGEMVFVPSGWHHQVHNLVMCCFSCPLSGAFLQEDGSTTSPLSQPERGWNGVAHGMTPSPSTTTGSMASTWPTCGASCSRSYAPCRRRSASGGTPCPTGTTTARSS
ncbi:2-oxoglutarate and iron-dependent oxygenase JMJD4 isoform X3 [Gorilla gorilla gorilla]|uniref:2-oxoglutarate and iron-dependent oxygenase JMJD4 isoform X3 n=1 Tax=Gorilla gorilla gorilla TaxID=9595 RepID=UPI00244612F9|nr:2-oxoglutarate and iron-dependent oxygenase JMJD4 isoform X2 [Gorilla gorilla gorilla]